MDRKIGFSTGALALGDFQRGIELQDRAGVAAIELSALREHELPGAIEALPLLDKPRFRYRSFHAPSAVEQLDDAALVRELQPVVDRRIPIVVHPDLIHDFGPWQSLGNLVMLENMDRRKNVCRTSGEMVKFFQELPEAQLCFDIGHARQIDPSMGVALDLLLRHQDRLAEVHISEVDWDCRHQPISTSAALAFQRLSKRIPEAVPIIIESVVRPDEIDKEIDIVRRCLDPRARLLSMKRANPACSAV